MIPHNSLSLQTRWNTSTSTSPPAYSQPYQLSHADVQSLITVLDAVTAPYALIADLTPISLQDLDPSPWRHRVQSYALALCAAVSLAFVAFKPTLMRDAISNPAQLLGGLKGVVESRVQALKVSTIGLSSD